MHSRFWPTRHPFIKLPHRCILSTYRRPASWRARMAIAPHSLTPKLSSHESRFGKHPTPTPQQTRARRYHHRRGWALATRYGPQPASQYRRGKHGSRLVAHSQHPEELPGKSGRSDLAQVTSRQDRRILTLTKTGVTPAARIRTVRPPSP